MNLSDLLALLGAIITLGTVGIAVLRWVIRAELREHLAPLHETTLTPLVARVAALEHRTEAIAEDVARLDAA